MRSFLIATTLLSSASAWAVMDPPASLDDHRIRIVNYDRNNPVEIYTPPGTTLRIELGAEETVAKVLPSDQGIILPESYRQPPNSPAANGAKTGQTPEPWPASCNQYLCELIVGNFIYLKPLVPLVPQPLFVQSWRPTGGTCQIEEKDGTTRSTLCKEYVSYTFELSSSTAPDPRAPPADVADNSPNPVVPSAKAPPTIWGVRFVYPDRVKQQAAAVQQERQRVWQAAAKPRAPIVKPDVPGADANWRYGYRGSAGIEPDAVWDDGRTTYLRFNGNRRVPNVYSNTGK